MISSIRRALIAWRIAGLEREHDLARAQLYDAAERASAIRRRITVAQQDLATVGKHRASVYQLRARP